MYRVYINSTVLVLDTVHNFAQYAMDKRHIRINYSGKHSSLYPYIDNAEKSDKLLQVALLTPDVEGLLADLKKCFKLVEAAGGVVANAQGQLLFIFRRGFWDLPKGKIDAGEQPDEAALREVTEETGIEHLTLRHPIMTSYHTYRNSKDERVLKPTYWYAMQTTDTQLTPQTEEDIERAVWMSAHEYLNLNEPKFDSITDVVQAYIRTQPD